MIRPISAAETRPIRQAVLRPNRPWDELLLPGDDHPQALHVGAFEDGRLVGIATVYPESPPEECRDEIPGGGAFRLRGMATLPTVRGAGYGRQLLEACFEHARAHGARVLWCNARVVALAFYRRMGLQTVEPEFEIEGIGPHYVMWRAL